MHGLLALAALHRKQLHSNEEDGYERTAQHHQTCALQASGSAFAHVTPGNCNALFASSSIITLLSFMHPLSTSNGPPKILDSFIDFMILIRGMTTVLHSVSDPKSESNPIINGKFGPLVDRQYHTLGFPLSPEIQDQFARLERLQSSSSFFQHVFSVVINALKAAFQTYAVIENDEGMVFVWASTPYEGFIAQLRSRIPFALTILAHYAVLLQCIDQLWWSKGKGLELVEAISDALPRNWQQHIAWPLQTLRNGRRLCMDNGVVCVTSSTAHEME